MIDVLIPTYNPNREHLTAALQSLQAQSRNDWKAFIHDDCSPKNETHDIVAPFLTDPRITYKRSPHRLGIGGNWNACLRQTTAPIVAYLFQDDLWGPDYLDAACAALHAHPTAGFVSMEHEYRAEGGMTNLPLYDAVQSFRAQHIKAGLHRGSELLRFWTDHELSPNIIREPSFVVMKRDAMQHAGPFLEDMPQFLDSEYWLRLLSFTDWINLTERSYGIFRVHPAAASAVNQVTQQGLFDRLRCFERLIDTLHGDERRSAIRARERALVSMIKKFLARTKKTGAPGPKRAIQGKQWFFGFCLRHPITILRALMHVLTSRAAT